MTFGSVPSVVYAEHEAGHGNFLPAAYRRIVADAAWRARLGKAYTASARVPRQHDRARRELDCACSSDALLMNIFCFPGMTTRPALCSLLGIASGVRPAFGVRAELAMQRGECDRTELDMVLGDLLVEAKLTETGFQHASFERVKRYEAATQVFDLDALPRLSKGIAGYQLLRGVLAAEAREARFLLLCDGRRRDLQQTWLQVLGAVRSYSLRSRMALVTWQEIAAATPPVLRKFLAQKYGIVP